MTEFMYRPFFALVNLGGGELILILVLLGILALPVVAAVLLACYFMARSSRKESSLGQTFPVAPPILPAASPDPDNQLRTLAKLRDDGVITEDDFNAKKKAILGL